MPSWPARSANLSGEDLAATSRKIASRLSVSNCASCFNCPSKNASLANAVLITSNEIKLATKIADQFLPLALIAEQLY